MSSDFIPVEVTFYDTNKLTLAGMRLDEKIVIPMRLGAIPSRDDFFRVEGVRYETGEWAMFRVVSVVHGFFANDNHTVHLTAELFVAHQP